MRPSKKNMLKSMTGYGKKAVTINGRTIVAEMRSLNSRGLEIILHMSGLFRHLEAEIRQRTAKILERGKIEIVVTIVNEAGGGSYQINPSMAKYYFEQVRTLCQETGTTIPPDVWVGILRLPDVVTQKTDEPTPENEFNLIDLIDEALLMVNDYRCVEGAALYNDLSQRVGNIQALSEQIKPFEARRKENIRQKIRNELQLLDLNCAIDENRFEQELIYYIEKIDFTEEMVRLQNHCSLFTQTMNQEGSQGKKLAFIAQEIGREINTLGSKANDGNIQSVVVSMKDELEKIKEQLLNIL